MMKQVVKERRTSSAAHHDILGELMNYNSKYRLGDDEIFDQIITLLYSGYETVSVTTMMTIKYLKDHPKALEEIIVHMFFINRFFFFFRSARVVCFDRFLTNMQEENLAIRKRKNADEPISWDDYKSMHFTRSVC